MGFSKSVLRITWSVTRFAVVAALRTPWVVVAVVATSGRVLRIVATAPLRLLAGTEDEVTCGRCGRRQSLLQRWRCPLCKAVESTHAWAPCSTCGTEEPAGYVACEDPRCGEAIQNPKLRGVS